MKKVSEIKWDDLRPNDKVKMTFAGTERTGRISELCTKEECPVDWENTITIDWDCGAISYIVYHSWCDRFEYVGRKGFSG